MRMQLADIEYLAHMLDEAFPEESRLCEDLSGAESTKFRNMLKKKVVRFEYKKKSTGEKREARGTLQKKYLPKYKEDRRPAYNQGGFVYWDVNKNDFRCFKRDNFIGVVDDEGEDGGEKEN